MDTLFCLPMQMNSGLQGGSLLASDEWSASARIVFLICVCLLSWAALKAMGEIRARRYSRQRREEFERFVAGQKQVNDEMMDKLHSIYTVRGPNGLRNVRRAMLDNDLYSIWEYGFPRDHYHNQHDRREVAETIERFFDFRGEPLAHSRSGREPQSAQSANRSS